MSKHVFSLSLLIALAIVAISLVRPKNPDAYDLRAAGELPTLVNGRLKPLDTVARTSLLLLQGRQRVVAPDGRTLSPIEWLLDVLYRPDLANHYATFEIVHPEVLALFELTPEEGAGKKRFSLVQLNKGLPELDRQAKLAENVDSALRTSFQRAVIQLREAIILFQRIQNSLLPPGDENYFDKLLSLAPTLNDSASVAKTPLIQELEQESSTMDTLGYLLPIPPESQMENLADWKSLGAVVQSGLATHHLNPAALSYARIGSAWKNHQPEAFNVEVRAYRAKLDQDAPRLLAKGGIEARFNAAQPFSTSMTLYVATFLLAVFSWLKWPQSLARAAFAFLLVAFAVTSLGIGTRMALENRPPVTNLYSSALFVGWGAVALCLVLECFFKNAIGSAAAGLLGFCTLLIAHHLALAGDTLEMMRAVLDSNFWLATHVVTVTVGYAATFLAGFFGLIYVLRGVFTRSLDRSTADGLGRMIYGIVCFATLFSFVGTVLGGIWADQSWGRFWGWDPKENGALIIVMWNAVILHARWGGMIKQRGLACAVIFGNIVTSWSWFGVNMLGVGLHSYGFMDAAFWWLIAFVVSQLVVISLFAIPTTKWRSPGI